MCGEEVGTRERAPTRFLPAALFCSDLLCYWPPVVIKMSLMASLISLVGIHTKQYERPTTPSSSSKKEDRVLVVLGIKNYGNSCFLNALLQGLAASPQVQRYFRSLDELLEHEEIYRGTSSTSSPSGPFDIYIWYLLVSVQRSLDLTLYFIDQQNII
jgi:ubiquitin C-terminal hydrolase